MSDTLFLDRLMSAKPGPVATAAEIERRSRVPLMRHGAHPGQKTRELLMSLGAGCWPEVIGPTATASPGAGRRRPEGRCDSRRRGGLAFI